MIPSPRLTEHLQTRTTYFEAHILPNTYITSSMHEDTIRTSISPHPPLADQDDSGAPESSMSGSPQSNAIADAFERRLQEQRQQAHAGTYSDFDENHEKRQHFRRLIDPGIMRPNARPLALEALQTLVTLADNILKHPNDPKYRRFKPTNKKIKTVLVDPKGTLEYAVEMGFRPEVDNFQPYYIFNERRMNDLRIGAAIIKEHLEQELTKEESRERARREEKAVSEAAKAKVKQAFMDDRKSVALQAQRDRVARESHIAAASSRTRESLSPPSSPGLMPGTGHTLTETTAPASSPPVYEL